MIYLLIIFLKHCQKTCKNYTYFLNFLTCIARDTLQDVRAWLIAVSADRQAMDGRRE